MKKLVILIGIFVLSFMSAHSKTSYLFDLSSVYEDYNNQIIYSGNDVVYVFPGQRYSASYGLHAPRVGSGERTVELVYKPEYLNLPLVFNDTISGFNLVWTNNSSGQESYFKTEIQENTFRSEWFYFCPRAYYGLGTISFINNLLPGDSLQYEFNVAANNFSGDNSYNEHHNRIIKCVDRIRGDVDDDGDVDYKDVEILLAKVGLYQERNYTEHGENIFAGCVLSSEPDMASIALIQVWINDNNDPRVRGLGIGEWMSQTQDYSDIEETTEKFATITSAPLDLPSNSISAYPNPFNNHITIISDMATEAVLINMQGQIMRQFHLELGHNQFSMVDLKPGIYFIRNAQSSFKIIKQ